MSYELCTEIQEYLTIRNSACLYHMITVSTYFNCFLESPIEFGLEYHFNCKFCNGQRTASLSLWQRGAGSQPAVVTSGALTQ